MLLDISIYSAERMFSVEGRNSEYGKIEYKILFLHVHWIGILSFFKSKYLISFQNIRLFTNECDESN